jgi:hypothetical protein
MATRDTNQATSPDPFPHHPAPDQSPTKSPQPSPRTVSEPESLEHSEQQQQRLYFFLWSFLMIFLLRFLHLSIFSSNAIIVLYLFWPNSFNFIFQENIFLQEFVTLLEDFLLSPLTNFTFQFLVNLILSPYVLYLIFVEEIQPFLSSHLPLLNRLTELSLFLSTLRNAPQDGDQRRNKLVVKINPEIRSSSSSMSTSSFQQKILGSDSDHEILTIESVDSFVSTEPFSPALTLPATSRGSTLTSPLPPIIQSPLPPLRPTQIPKELTLLDPEEDASDCRCLLSNSQDYLQEHHVQPLPFSNSLSKQPKTHLAIDVPVTPMTGQLHDFPSNPHTPPTAIPQQTPTPGSRGNDYLTKLQRVARQSTAEKKKRTSVGKLSR